mmetsp:Transcript_45667/g.130355  ORF Transcript_45667/g.130355 Transcript_45667/m.130355 type:complete len:856 (+) Transcript_45667:1422-3989(+)
MSWLAEASHVLDSDHVRARSHALPAEVRVVLQGVDLLVLREEVASEAHGDLRNLVHGADRLDGHLHLLHVVEAVEDPVHVHARLGGDLDELLHDVVRVGLVAHAVGPTEQHLEADVRDGLPELGQALEGVLVQEAVGHVEGGASPVLEREELVQLLAHLGGRLQHVHRAHPRRHQGLVRVAHRGVRHEHARLRRLPHPLRHRLWAALVQDAFGVLLRLEGCVHLPQHGGARAILGPLALKEGVLALDRPLREVLEDLRGRLQHGPRLLLLLHLGAHEGLALLRTVLLELAHAPELGVALLDEGRLVQRAQLLEAGLHKGLEVVQRGWEVLAGLAVLLPDHVVDDAQLLELRRVDALDGRQGDAVLRELLLLVRVVLVAAQNRRGSLRRDCGVPRLGEHADLVAHGDGQRSARAALAHDHGDDGHLQTGHCGKVRRDGLALPCGLSVEGGPRANGVDECQDWQAEALGQGEEAQSRAVALRRWHGMVELLALDRRVALGALDHDDAAAALQLGKAASQALVEPRRAVSVAAKLEVLGAHLGHDVVRVDPVQIPGLGEIRRGQVPRGARGCLRDGDRRAGALGLQHREHLPRRGLQLCRRHDHVDVPVVDPVLHALEDVGAGLVVGALVHAELGVEDDCWAREAQAPALGTDPHVRLHGVGGADPAVAGVHEQRDEGEASLTESAHGTGHLRHLHQRERALVHPGTAARALDHHGQTIGSSVLKAASQLLALRRTERATEEAEIMLHPHDLHAFAVCVRWVQGLEAALDGADLLRPGDLFLQLLTICDAAKAEIQKVIGADLCPERLALLCFGHLLACCLGYLGASGQDSTATLEATRHGCMHALTAQQPKFGLEAA